MLTFDDCLKVCCLSEDEIDAIAEHENRPEMIALELGNYLVRTPDGRLRIKAMILDDIAAAMGIGTHLLEAYGEHVAGAAVIIHSENDYRVPIEEGEQWFMALKKRHVPVELVRYPRSSHGLSRAGEPWLLVDRLGRLRQWFSYWLQGEGTPVAATPSP